MITYRVEINDGAVSKLFNRFGHSQVMQVLRPPMEASLLSLHDDLTDYPPPSRGKVTFKSAKQRRYFFWALKNGVITVVKRAFLNTKARSDKPSLTHNSADCFKFFS
jgi:hypothetical protein